VRANSHLVGVVLSFKPENLFLIPYVLPSLRIYPLKNATNNKNCPLIKPSFYAKTLTLTLTSTEKKNRTACEDRTYPLHKMSAARPLITVWNTDGSKRAEVALPSVMTAPLRPDVVQFVHTNMAKNSRQAYSVQMKAGHQTSATSWGTGRAVSRIPRVNGGGTQRSGQAAFGNMCRSGRMFAPTKTWRKWHRKINTSQKRYAVASSLAASAVPALVMARGHNIDQIPECPLVLSSDAERICQTSWAVKALTSVGAFDDVEKAAKSKGLRCGKGKGR